MASTTTAAQRWRQLMPDDSAIAIQAIALYAQTARCGETTPAACVRLKTGGWIVLRAAPIARPQAESGKPLS
jgi:hypothetical protein